MKKHYSPKTGKLENCHAKEGNCPLGGPDVHFDPGSEEGERYVDNVNKAISKGKTLEQAKCEAEVDLYREREHEKFKKELEKYNLTEDDIVKVHPDTITEEQWRGMEAYDKPSGSFFEDENGDHYTTREHLEWAGEAYRGEMFQNSYMEERDMSLEDFYDHFRFYEVADYPDMGRDIATEEGIDWETGEHIESSNGVDPSLGRIDRFMDREVGNRKTLRKFMDPLYLENAVRNPWDENIFDSMREDEDGKAILSWKVAESEDESMGIEADFKFDKTINELKEDWDTKGESYIFEEEEPRLISTQIL